MTSSRTLSQAEIAALARRPGIGSDAPLGRKPRKPTAKQMAGPNLGAIYASGSKAPAASGKLPGVTALRGAASDARSVNVTAKKRLRFQATQVRQDNAGKAQGRRRQRKSLAAGG